MTMLASARIGALHDVHDRPRASRRTDAITLALAMWMNLGGQVDGWAHAHYDLQTEGVFTPWHGLFYSGFVACAAWICWQVVRARQPGSNVLAAVPAGYGLGLVGLGIFALGGVGDLTWHTVLGIEQDLAALLSPTHLLLLVGSMLIESIPLRAAWAARDDRDSATLGAFLLPLLSLSLLVVDASFFLSYFSAFANVAPAVPGVPELHGIGSALITNVVLLVPTLLLLRRWNPPFGAICVLYGVVAVLTSGLTGFATAVTIVPALAGGLAADLAIRRLRPSPARPAVWTAFAMLAPAALWASYYMTLQVTAGIVWDVELAAGLVVLNTLVGIALGLLSAGCPLRFADDETGHRSLIGAERSVP